MIIIVDASIVAAVILPDEVPPDRDKILTVLREGDAAAPPLFWDELRNLVWKAERRGRIGAQTSEPLLRDFRLTAPQILPGRGDDEILTLARTHGLTAYDAAYGALAVHEDAPLATLDRRLIAAGEAGAFRLWRPA